MVQTYLGEWRESVAQRWEAMLTDPNRRAYARSARYRAECLEGRMPIGESIQRHNAACDVARAEVRATLRRIVSETSGSPDANLEFVTWLMYRAEEGRRWADTLANSIAPADVLGDHEGFDRWVRANTWLNDREHACLTADVVLFARREGQLCVLLIQRKWDPFAGSWALPGGHVDPGEDTESAARRELREETGLRVEPVSLLHVGVRADPRRDPRGRYASFVYAAELPGPPPEPKPGDDAAAAQWWPTGDVNEELVAFDHYQMIQDARRLIALRQAASVSGDKTSADRNPIRSIADGGTNDRPFPTTFGEAVMEIMRKDMER